MEVIKYRVWDGKKMMYPKDCQRGAGSGVMVLLMDMLGRCSWNNPYGFQPEEDAGDNVYSHRQHSRKPRTDTIIKIENSPGCALLGGVASLIKAKILITI